MRKLTLVLTVVLLVATACLAQPTGQPAPRLLSLARVLNSMVDLELLDQLAPLKLSNEQLGALAAVYQQYPLPPIDPAPAQEAADKLEQMRAKLIAGDGQKRTPAEEQAMGQMLEVAFKEFSHGPRPQEKPGELSVPEKLVWAILTDAQKVQLLGGADDKSNQVAAQSALKLIGELRGRDSETWASSRDRLAVCLSKGAGADGSPQRENSRQMFLDFLNRLKRMSDADFANKQKELTTEFLALLPPGCNLAFAMADFDPITIHNALGASLLAMRAPGLLQEVQAARAKKPGG